MNFSIKYPNITLHQTIIDKLKNKDILKYLISHTFVRTEQIHQISDTLPACYSVATPLRFARKIKLFATQSLLDAAQSKLCDAQCLLFAPKSLSCGAQSLLVGAQCLLVAIECLLYKAQCLLVGAQSLLYAPTRLSCMAQSLLVRAQSLIVGTKSLNVLTLLLTQSDQIISKGMIRSKNFETMKLLE